MKNRRLISLLADFCKPVISAVCSGVHRLPQGQKRTEGVEIVRNQLVSPLM
jgi:hypothetical protein